MAGYGNVEAWLRIWLWDWSNRAFGGSETFCGRRTRHACDDERDSTAFAGCGIMDAQTWELNSPCLDGVTGRMLSSVLSTWDRLCFRTGTPYNFNPGLWRVSVELSDIDVTILPWLVRGQVRSRHKLTRAPHDTRPSRPAFRLAPSYDDCPKSVDCARPHPSRLRP